MKNKYRQEIIIGKGAFGNVYKASRREVFAMKKFIQMPTEQDLIEISLMQSIKSKYLCRLEDVFVGEDKTFNIMIEYARHGNLKDYCEKTLYWIIPEDLCKEWLASIALGLKELHQRNIIHRDIKPENILVFDKYDVRIADYGQAKVIQDTIGNQNHPHTVTGTLRYMSIEMVTGKDYNSSTDIYSLGVTLIYLLTREYPDWEKLGGYSKWLPDIKGYSIEFKKLIRSMININKSTRPTVNDIINSPLIKDTNVIKEYKKSIFFQQTINNSEIRQNVQELYSSCNLCKTIKCEKCLEDQIPITMKSFENILQIQDALDKYNNQIETLLANKQKLLSSQIKIPTDQLKELNSQCDTLQKSSTKLQELVQQVSQTLEKKIVKVMRTKRDSSKIAPQRVFQIQRNSIGVSKNIENVQLNIESQNMFSTQKKVNHSRQFSMGASNTRPQIRTQDKGYQDFMRLVDTEINKESTSILRSVIPDIKQKTFTLLYQASKQGFHASKFHELCDNQGPTVSFIMSEAGQVFGGYTSISFSSPQYFKYIEDPQAFLFQLNKRSVHVQKRKQDCAVQHSKDRLMVFGHGQDLSIFDQSNQNFDSFSNLGGTYDLPINTYYNTKDAQEYLAGEHYFKIMEIEVYSLI
eukprot:403348014